MTDLFYKKRLEAIRELLSRETDEGPVMSLAALDDPHTEQDFWELLNTPVAAPQVKQYNPQPTAWTNSSSLDAMRAGKKGFIFATPDEDVPIPLYAAQPLPAPAAKPLEWEEAAQQRSAEEPIHEPTGDYEAETPFGFYCIEMYFGTDSYGWKVTFDSIPVADTDDPDAAKAAAQADYESRILAALEAAPASGIEARSDETRSGSVEDESPVGNAETPDPTREEADDKYQAAKRKVWGGAPVAATDTQLEAEALVKRLRGYMTMDLIDDVTAFIARHHLGEKP